MSTMVVYTSRTGNTKKIATEIFSAIPDPEKDLQDIQNRQYDLSADTFFVGFWNNRGSCPLEIIDLLSALHGKRIALFGTCGLGNDPQYFHTIESNVKVWIPEDNTYLGCFMCQGKMPMAVRTRYESMRNEGNSAQIDFMLHNFDEALLHPDDQDAADARAFAKKVCCKDSTEKSV